MKQVTVTELKNKLSAYLRLVKKGQTLEVLDRSIPVARIEPAAAPTGQGVLEQLARDGIVVRARKKSRKDFFKKPPFPCQADPVQALIEERGNR
jgi:prevent-host-death family protein